VDRSTEKLQRTSAERLTQRVVSRLRIAGLCVKFSSTMCWLGAASLVALLIRRLCGVGPDWFTADALAVLPVLAVLIALGTAKKPTVGEAARSIDTTCGADELFLTLVQLQSSGGGYQAVVAQQAEKVAAGIRPSEVVPWRWRQPAARLAGGAVVIVVVMLFLPQLDLFGAAESADAAVAVRRDLEASRRETFIRAAELTARRESAVLADGAEESLAELAAELRRLTDDRSAVSLQELESRQRSVEARWREAKKDQDVARLVENVQANQFLGQAGNGSQQWVEDLAEGQTDSLDEAFATLQDELAELASSGDEADRQERERQIRKQIAELQRFAGNQLESQFAETAMKRAMSQLDSMRLEPDLKSEAAAAAQESIDLAQQEMGEIAQNAQQLASLEKALDAIQSAKQLAQSGDGKSGQKDEARIQEFVDQYAKMQGEDGKENSGNDQHGENEGSPNSPDQQVASTNGQSGSKDEGKPGATSQGKTAGQSTNGSSGQGSGRVAAQENDRAETAFRDERESRNLDENRRLMAMRRQGLSEAGEVSEEYRELVRSLQKRVSTAIEVEEIPPGYVSGIRRYFDSLDQSSREDSLKGGSSTVESEANPDVDGSGEAADDAP
jgi:hypothetical protein